MLPEDDRVIELCRSVSNVLMQILDFLNNIYIYIYVCVCVHVLVCVTKVTITLVPFSITDRLL